MNQMMQCLLLWLLPLLQTAGSHKCFVCGPDVGKPEDLLEIRRTFPNVKVPLCSKYRQSSREEYLRECPINSHGCLTKFEDNGSVLRTCAPVGIDDCKKANGVNYCYCSRDGCNTPDRRLSEPSPSDHVSSKAADSAPAGSRHRQGHELSLSVSAAASALNGGGHGSKSAGGGGDAPPVDDEDNKEGSGGEAGGDWESYYYESYYDGRGVGGSPAASPGSEDDDLDDEDELSPNANDGLGPDTEPGDGEFSDLTEPPPFLVEQQLEEELAKISQSNNNKNKHNNNKGGSRHKFDRVEEDDIIIDDGYGAATTTAAAAPPSRPADGRRTSGAEAGRSTSMALLVACLAWLVVMRR